VKAPFPADQDHGRQGILSSKITARTQSASSSNNAPENREKRLPFEAKIVGGLELHLAKGQAVNLMNHQFKPVIADEIPPITGKLPPSIVNEPSGVQRAATLARD
jgi:hypothetical protein